MDKIFLTVAGRANRIGKSMELFYGSLLNKRGELPDELVSLRDRCSPDGSGDFA